MIKSYNKVNNLVSIVLVVLSIGLAYFVGTTQAKPIKNDNTKLTEEINNLKEVINVTKKNKLIFQDTGLYIPSLEESQDCIEQFPIKVKLEKGDNKYYSKTNKQYQKAKADLCLKNESVLLYLSNIRPG
jgi:hypothetical protein